MLAWLALPVLAVAILALAWKAHRSAGSRSAPPAWEEPRSAEEVALRRAVGALPGDPAAHRRLGLFFMRRAQPFEAIWEFQETLALRPDDGEARSGMAAALDAVALPGLAEALLQQPVALPPDDLERRLALARLRLRYADGDGAAGALRGAEARLAQVPAGLLAQGRALQANGDRAGAEAVFRRLLRQAPGSMDGYYWLGRLLLEEGRAADARTVLTAGQTVAPADARFPFYLGLSYLPAAGAANGRVPGEAASRAWASFEEALRLAPRHALPLYQLGLLEAREGRWEAAARHLDTAVEADPDHVDAYRELARALAALKQHPQDAYYRGLYLSKVERPAAAVREFQAVAAARPDSPEGPLLVSRMFVQTMQYAPAIAALQPALGRFPQNAEIFGQLSALYKLTGSRSAAERLCQQWRQALPQASEPYWIQGKMRVTDGRIPEGIQLYEQALAREPERADYLLFLGQALAQRGAPDDLPRALDLLGRAVRNAPQDAAARLQFGLLLQRLGRPGEARDQVLRSLDLDPHQAPPMNSLVQIAYQLHRPAPASFFAGAVREVEKHLREESRVMRTVWDRPQSAEAHFAAADFRRRTGDLGKARAQLEQALELRPHWLDAERELLRINRAVDVQ
jgi:tetratricopeptide (TPR) repeat protein